MPDAQPDQSLHLPSLVIKNFRGIDELTIPRLGRVTLLAGKNGVGKTTVLDAVRAFAARGRTSVLSNLLLNRDEIVSAIDQDGSDTVVPDWDALFSGRRIYAGETISMGPNHDANAFQIRVVPIDEVAFDQLALFQSDTFADEDMVGLEITFQDSRRTILLDVQQNDERSRIRHLIGSVTMVPRRGIEPPAEVVCNNLGPDLPENAAIDQFWDEVALTIHEERAVEALNLVTAANVERIGLVGANTRNRPRSRSRVLAKVNDQDTPVPLRSLGDGAVRVFSVALALASSSNGFLLIDEVENGIHHSVQAKFWEMVLKTAERNNVQVLATTHSSDCAYRFGQVASELEDIEGILYRIQRNVDRLRAVPYPEDQLVIAAEHRIEVR